MLDQTTKRCVQLEHGKEKMVKLATQESFTFDYVAHEETSQCDIFNSVGKTIIDQCMMGYNGSIFAYG